ncbi:MAG: class I SAM-dependent methyltransferase [Bacteroidota bacterium]
MEHNYIEVNKNLWNKKVAHHVESAFYDVPGFLAGKSSLKAIELDLLGDIKGKSLLHLQCHFGQDTISLARMGASTTGVDFSDAAIEKATELARQTNADAQFICTDIYQLPEVLDKQYDIVFTSYGTIGWLPDMDKWAGVVSRFLKPGGKFIIVDFHPVVWMFDNEFSHIQYPYFNQEAIIETLSGTYADRDAPIQESEVGWNHPLTEILSALLSKGLNLKHFGEYDYSPYNCFSKMEEFEAGKFRISHLENKIPMVYSIVMSK